MSQFIALEAGMKTCLNPNAHHITVASSGNWDWVVRPSMKKCLSREAQTRLSWFEWHESHGENVSKTARHFGITPRTFYTWRERFKSEGLAGLESRSHRPHRARRPTWTATQVEAVRAIREQYPCMGKDKIAILLARTGTHLSVSMVGRILSDLRRRNLLREPIRVTKRRKRTCHPRPWAVRKPKGWAATSPGDLVQVDTKDVRPIAGKAFKHLSLVDVVSRYAVAEVGIGATAATMAEYLDSMLDRVPYPVQAVQIDGGSEFKGEFETYCKAKGLTLFVLPPYSPKLNGCVERIQRTFDEEFYQCTDADLRVEPLRTALREYETVYNTIRPHQSLGYLTPQESLDARKEASCQV